MAKIKFTKTAVEAAQPQAKDVELRDTVVPGFLCKITPGVSRPRASGSCDRTPASNALDDG